MLSTHQRFPMKFILLAELRVRRRRHRRKPHGLCTEHLFNKDLPQPAAGNIKQRGHSSRISQPAQEQRIVQILPSNSKLVTIDMHWQPPLRLLMQSRHNSVTVDHAYIARVARAIKTAGRHNIPLAFYRDIPLKCHCSCWQERLLLRRRPRGVAEAIAGLRLKSTGVVLCIIKQFSCIFGGYTISAVFYRL